MVIGAIFCYCGVGPYGWLLACWSTVEVVA